MTKRSLIPLFPLPLLPLPGELVPLHIFEPRYRQLLADAETTDISFGILSTHACNRRKLGALMKLESVIKRYPGGESDIVVRCIDNFSLDRFFEHYGRKLYPGGRITPCKLDETLLPGLALYKMFITFQGRRNIKHHFQTFSVFQIAAELNLGVTDRYHLLTLRGEKRESFLLDHLRFQLHVIQQEQKSREVYHLN